MKSSFKLVIDKSKSILIILPTNPNFDQVAAGLSLFLSLRQDREVQVFSPTPMTVEFNRLIGVNKITQKLGNRNLVIRFVDYKADDIERVSYDIENGQFKLTVVPKPGVTPPSENQVDLSYSGIFVDTAIIIGGTDESHFPAISSQELLGANIVHIGTQDISMSANKNYISFSRPASSICEIIFGLLTESQFLLDSDVATNLLMGIEEASQEFKGEAVTADTFSAVAELMRAGGRRQPPKLAANSFPPGSIPGQFPKFKPQTQISGQIQQTQAQNQKVKQGNLSQDQIDDSGEISEEEAPSDWLRPKIYKGTSVS